MSDDEYFTDDIVFDEQALRALDQAESQYASTQQQRARTPPYVPPPARATASAALARQPSASGQPPAKRQRMGGGFLARAPSTDDMDSMPAIRVDLAGGFYGSASQARSQSQSSQSFQTAVPGPSQPARGLARAPTQRGSFGGGGYARVASFPARGQPAARGGIGGRTLARSQSHPSPNASQAGPSTQRVVGSQRAPATQRNPSIRAGILEAVRQSRAEDNDNLDVSEMRRQLDQLQRENQEAKTALAAAVNEKRAKAGEVAILRQNLERASDAHGAELGALRVARATLEAQHAELLRAHAADMERMRTQLAFKQHELHAVARQAKPAPTPSSQMGGWNSTPAPAPVAGSSVRRAPPPPAAPPVPTTPHRPRTQAPQPQLPGFVNAFAPASQAPRTPRRAEPAPSHPPTQEAAFFAPEPSSVGWGEQPIWTPLPPPPPPPAPVVTQAPSPPASPRRVAMDVDTPAKGKGKEKETEREAEKVEAVDWLARLNQLLYTHIFEPTGANAFQTVLGAAVLPADAKAYASLCRSASAALGTARPSAFLDGLPESLSSLLARMLRLLANASAARPLGALCSLCAALALAVPRFAAALVAPPDAAPASSLLLQLARAITHLLAKDEGEGDVGADMARAALRLLDVLVWTAPRACDEAFVELPRQNKSLLVALLADAHATWFLALSTRALASLAARAPAHLLAPAKGPNEPARADYAKLPQLERLCAVLRDPARADAHAPVLDALCALACAPPAAGGGDAPLSALVASRAVVPTLVLVLGALCAPVFEEDEAVLADSAALDARLRRIMLVTLLLHRLAARLGPSLKLKVNAQRHGPYAGAGHVFVVTLTRLCYAPIPEEVQGAQRRLLEDAGEIAEAMLEFVVDGPEADMAYDAYNEEEPEARDGSAGEIEVDEDEADAEASMLG